MPRYTRVIKKEAHSTTVGILSAGIGNKIKSAKNNNLFLFSSSLNLDTLLDISTITINLKRIHINNEVSVPPKISLYIILKSGK